jgi:5-formyltetrahydrofolate cyclo-ligase
MNKSELRKFFLEKQKSIGKKERELLSQKLSKNFFDNFDLSNVRILHCFLPIEKFNEINTMLIFERIWEDFPSIKTFAPKVNFQNGEIESIRFQETTKTEENRWQIKEPKVGESIEPSEIDMILVPLLCFDLNGFRVGYGKGFYDRFLRKCRPNATKIGICYFEPVNKIIDIQDHDVRLDFCITPELVFRFLN